MPAEKAEKEKEREKNVAETTVGFGRTGFCAFYTYPTAARSVLVCLSEAQLGFRAEIRTWHKLTFCPYHPACIKLKLELDRKREKESSARNGPPTSPITGCIG